MDKPNVPVPPKEDENQIGTSMAVNPVPNLGFGGTVEVPQLFNPAYAAAAAAALAMANQQMAQASLQQQGLPGTTQQQQNVALQAPVVNSNPVAQTQPAPVAETQLTDGSANSNAVVHPAASSIVNPIQQLAALPLAAAQNPFAAALLSGGLLPGMAAAAAVQQAAAAPALVAQHHHQQQHNTVQQQLANSAALNAATATAASAPKKKKTTKRAPRKAHKAKPKASRATHQQQNNVPRAAVAAAAAQVVAAHAAATSNGVMANAVFANMQNWKLDQLESHVQLLRDSGQPIPQPVALLLADARRKEEKRTAKRAANRKSACSSRARKKALVEEMTKANARLRRQAMILALLPDLVIAITVDGKITFCSAQVERVLRHKTQHLVGANFSDILIPSSRDRLAELVRELLAAEQAATLGTAIAGDAKPAANAEIGQASGQEASSGGEANPVSDGSFPMAVVNFANEPISAEDNSDLSASNGGGTSNGGGKTDDAQRSSPKEGGAVEANDATQVKSDVSSGSGSNQRQQSSSDDSFSSSNDAKNLRKANEALGRNVRWHNEKLASEGKVGKKKSSHKDDVTGASVTANNADARLSSLQVRADPSSDGKAVKRKASRYDSLEEEQSSSSSSDLMLDAIEKKKARKNGIENSSEDSGYRESNQSEEDTFDDSSSLRNGPRPKPLAPACNICLIREDLTTIWCEVTSSIRTRSIKDESGEEQVVGSVEAKAASSNGTQSAEEDPSSKDEIKELLLCLRPIRDGEETVDESLRFVPPKNVDLSDSTGLTDSAEPSSSSNSVDGKVKARPPPKKRPIVSEPSSSSLSNDSNDKLNKKRRVGEAVTEKSAVESLMLMGNNA